MIFARLSTSSCLKETTNSFDTLFGILDDFVHYEVCIVHVSRRNSDNNTLNEMSSDYIREHHQFNSTVNSRT